MAMYKPMTDQEAKAMIESAAKDKEIADNMRAYWIERADGVEPFMGGDE